MEDDGPSAQGGEVQRCPGPRGPARGGRGEPPLGGAGGRAVSPGLVRLSVGLEDPRDLLEDVARALDVATG